MPLTLLICCGWAGCRRRGSRPPEIRELRELTRYRQKLVGLRTSCKDQVHAVLAKLGIAVACSDVFGVWGSAWLDGLALPQPYAGKVTAQERHDALNSQRLSASRGAGTEEQSKGS